MYKILYIFRTMSSDRTDRLRKRTVAVFYSQNPKSIRDESTRTSVRVGQMITPCLCACSEPIPSPISVSDSVDIRGAPYLDIYTIYYDITWSDFANAVSYSYSTTCPDEYIFVSTGITSARLYIIWATNVDFSITIIGINPCGSASSNAISTLPCFLAGSCVLMHDGTTKLIENVLVGDIVIGAFGEMNTVLALHRPILGNATMCNINNEHWTTSHHPHISIDRKFYCMDPALTHANTYGRMHEVLNSYGEKEMMMLYGLAEGRLQKIEIGTILKTSGGGKSVSSLDTQYMPPDTQLYNLVVGGSHTYHVDSYTVTGWPREDDFNYDMWAPKEK